MTGALVQGMKAFLLLSAGSRVLAEHPCSSEVDSACPDRPGSDVAACLKDSKEHETATEISSECTDFIALNKACAEDIEKKCDGAFFSDDTIICLTQWTEKEELSKRCQGVLSWAVPNQDDEEEEAVDETQMTEEEVEEKKEWQAKRKAVRTEAIERMKMKDVDRKKEEDRVALEDFRKENPEAYEQMMKEQEEEKRQKAEFAKMERARAAAFARKKEQEAGLGEEAAEETDTKPAGGSGSGKSKKNKGSSWTYSIFSFGVVGVVLYGVYFLATGQTGGGARKTGGGAGGGGGGGGSKQKSGKKKH